MSCSKPIIAMDTKIKNTIHWQVCDTLHSFKKRNVQEISDNQVDWLKILKFKKIHNTAGTKLTRIGMQLPLLIKRGLKHPSTEDYHSYLTAVTECR